MSIESKRLAEIDEGDILTLIEDKEPEGKTIEYKSTLPQNDDQQRIKFLRGASSLANAAGGVMLFGIRAEQGIPIEIVGVGTDDVDSEKLRLENLLQSGIRPRIHGIDITGVETKDGQNLVIMRIPSSWTGPHMVTYGGGGRQEFYSRNSAGKYPLDVDQIRRSFLQSDSSAETARHFRAERIGKIVAGEAPVSIDTRGTMVLHAIPLYSQFQTGLDILAPKYYLDRDVENLMYGVRTLSGKISELMYNFQGRLGLRSIEGRPSYVQFYRNGIIEMGDNMIIEYGPYPSQVPFADLPEKVLWIPNKLLENNVISAIESVMRFYDSMNVEPPITCFLSLLNVRGCYLPTRWEPASGRPTPFRDSVMNLPDTTFESYDVDVAKRLHSVFNMIWNAAGYSSSQNYDAAGNRSSQ